MGASIVSSITLPEKNYDLTSLRNRIPLQNSMSPPCVLISRPSPSGALRFIVEKWCIAVVTPCGKLSSWWRPTEHCLFIVRWFLRSELFMAQFASKMSWLPTKLELPSDQTTLYTLWDYWGNVIQVGWMQFQWCKTPVSDPQVASKNMVKSEQSPAWVGKVDWPGCSVESTLFSKGRITPLRIGWNKHMDKKRRKGEKEVFDKENE